MINKQITIKFNNKWYLVEYVKLHPYLESTSHKMKHNSSVKLEFFEKDNVLQIKKKNIENIENQKRVGNSRNFKFCIYSTMATLNLLLVIRYQPFHQWANREFEVSKCRIVSELYRMIHGCPWLQTFYPKKHFEVFNSFWI